MKCGIKSLTTVPKTLGVARWLVLLLAVLIAIFVMAGVVGADGIFAILFDNHPIKAATTFNHDKGNKNNALDLTTHNFSIFEFTAADPIESASLKVQSILTLPDGLKTSAILSKLGSYLC